MILASMVQVEESHLMNCFPSRRVGQIRSCGIQSFPARLRPGLKKRKDGSVRTQRQARERKKDLQNWRGSWRDCGDRPAFERLCGGGWVNIAWRTEEQEPQRIEGFRARELLNGGGGKKQSTDGT